MKKLFLGIFLLLSFPAFTHAYCAPPPVYTYTNESQCAALAEAAFREGSEYTSGGSDPSAACYSQVDQYESANESYQSCLEDEASAPPATISPIVTCKLQFGSHSVPSPTKTGYCSCVENYHFDSDSMCVKDAPVPVPKPVPIPVSLDDSCRSQYGIQSVASTTDTLYCACIPGYQLTLDSPVRCVAKPEDPPKIVPAAEVPAKTAPRKIEAKAAAATTTAEERDEAKTGATTSLASSTPAEPKPIPWYRRLLSWMFGK